MQFITHVPPGNTSLKHLHSMNTALYTTFIYIVKLGYAGLRAYTLFSYFVPKHRFWVFDRTVIIIDVMCKIVKTIQHFLMIFFSNFAFEKISHRQVFVMYSPYQRFVSWLVPFSQQPLY